MNSDVARLNSESLVWLRDSVLPLWTRAGFDSAAGAFEESLLETGAPAGEPRRAMVQARQSFALRCAVDLGVFPADRAASMIAVAASNLVKRYQLESGAFMHSLRVDGTVADARPDLYTQAFAMFGLAHAYAVVRDPSYAAAALRVVEYLQSARHLPEGGFSELTASGDVLLATNPHMHLFEAALAWLDVDSDSREWRRFADQLAELALRRFVDPRTGFIGEEFLPGWQFALSGTGAFMFEPGHQYEWCWLFERYAVMAGKNLRELCTRLFSQTEACGVAESGAVYDQMWSDRTVKSATSRFWPHTERIKAAAYRAIASRDRAAADVACASLVTLRKYFELPVRGLWTDTMNPDGSFKPGNAKGSSLYHIIGAMVEFDRLARSRNL